MPLRLTPLLECLVTARLVSADTREQDLAVVLADTIEGPELRVLERARFMRRKSAAGFWGSSRSNGAAHFSPYRTPAPCAILRVANCVTANTHGNLSREHYALESLQSLLSKHLQESVPRSAYFGSLPLFFDSTPTVSVVGGAPGVPLSHYRASSSKERRRALAVLLAWLADFQRETHSRRARRTLPPLSHRLREGLQHLDRNTGLTRYEDELLEALLHRTSNCDGWICAAHGELRSTAVTWDRHQLRVPRWYSFREQEFGFVDAGEVVYRWIKSLPRNGRRSAQERTHLRGQTTRFLAQVGYAELTPEDLLTLYLLEALRRRASLAHQRRVYSAELSDLRLDLAAALAGKSLFEFQEEWGV